MGLEVQWKILSIHIELELFLKVMFEALEIDEIMRPTEGHDEGVEDGALKGQEGDEVEETAPEWCGKWEERLATAGR